MTASSPLKIWLRECLEEFRFEIAGVARLSSTETWPVTFRDAVELRDWLSETGQLQPLPAEPAALANILEQALADFIETRCIAGGVATLNRGTDRGYPDLEVSSPQFGDGFHAVDIKVARRKYGKRAAKQTQSRITLYTGNTYFKWPDLHWPGTPRPFGEYRAHLDVVLIYTYAPDLASRIADPEILVHESWRIASKQRSSTTREYIGAVLGLEQLRSGAGEFASADEFYNFWRRFQFKTSAQVSKQLERLVKSQSERINEQNEQLAVHRANKTTPSSSDESKGP